MTEKRIYPSDPDFKAIDYLAGLIAISANPHLHLLGYGMGETQVEQVIKKFNDDADFQDLKDKLKEAQQRLLVDLSKK